MPGRIYQCRSIRQLCRRGGPITSHLDVLRYILRNAKPHSAPAKRTGVSPPLAAARFVLLVCTRDERPDLCSKAFDSNLCIGKECIPGVPLALDDLAKACGSPFSLLSIAHQPHALCTSKWSTSSESPPPAPTECPLIATHVSTVHSVGYHVIRRCSSTHVKMKRRPRLAQRLQPPAFPMLHVCAWRPPVCNRVEEPCRSALVLQLTICEGGACRACGFQL